MKLTLDFETQSKYDITVGGAWNYSKDPSTDILCLAYAVDDKSPKMWIPPKHAIRYIFNVRAKHKGLIGHFSRVKGTPKKITKRMRDAYALQEPFEWGKQYTIFDGKRTSRGFNWDGPLTLPIWSKYRIKSKPDFVDHIDSLEFEAHNAFFEKSMWKNVCVEKYGFPEIPDEKWSCSAALAATRALPRALDKAGEALNLPVQKNHDGKLVMLQLSRPDQEGNFNYDPMKYTVLYNYCIDDVRAERELSKRLGTLNAYERRIWLLDQKINFRGVPLDTGVIEGAVKIIETYTKVLETEMSKLTDGRLTNIRQVAALQLWLEENKVLVDNVQKGTVEEVLSRDNISPKVRRVLEIRQALGQTSTAKYYAMRNFCAADGTAKDQFLYSGASTLRWSGKGIQFQNLPRGSIKATEDIYAAIKSGSWRQVRLHGDVMDILSSSVRGVAYSGVDKDFLDADFSNIEGRVLAWIAGEQWKIEAFEEFDKGIGEDLYILAYARAFGIETSDVDDAKRQVGKVMELACFAPDTQVLTKCGYKSIIDISETDKLWDGIKWVKSGGRIYRGEKETMLLDGIRMTPDHKVLVQKEWLSALTVGSNENTLSLALETGSENLPFLELNTKTLVGSIAPKKLNSLSHVYDILNAGPRNRFTIKTDSGHLLVHNCGYQGSVGAFQKMASVYGVEIPDDRAKELVALWRAANPIITAFWPAMETAAKKAIMTGREIQVNDRVSFAVVDDFLEMRTAAGSTLYYYQPRVEEIETQWGSKKQSIVFTGVNSVTRKVERQSTYGGKLTENLVQHLARMLLCDSMLDLDKNGFDIRMHIHDQVVSLVPSNDPKLNVETYDKIMQTRREWCPTLPLAAKGEVIKRFKKG